MIDNLRCARATPDSRCTPPSSGPRWNWLSFIRCSKAASCSRRPARSKIPAIPHILLTYRLNGRTKTQRKRGRLPSALRFQLNDSATILRPSTRLSASSHNQPRLKEAQEYAHVAGNRRESKVHFHQRGQTRSGQARRTRSERAKPHRVQTGFSYIRQQKPTDHGLPSDETAFRSPQRRTRGPKVGGSVKRTEEANAQHAKTV